MIAIAAIAAVAVAGSQAPPPAAQAPPSTLAAAPLASVGAAPATLITPPVPGGPAAGEPPPQDAAIAILDAFQAAQSLQGPLDGRWRLSDLDGRALLLFQLADPGTANAAADSTIEGAWRDPNRAGATDSSGFLDHVDRRKDGLSIRFYARDGDPPIEITLRPAAGGGWRGELYAQGERLRVVMAPF